MLFWALLSDTKSHWWQRTSPKLLVTAFQELSYVIEGRGMVTGETKAISLVTTVAESAILAKRSYRPGTRKRPVPDMRWLQPRHQAL